MAPVSLSSSLFSVTMCNLGSSPWLLTMSFHIMLLYTRSYSQQSVTQLLCLKVRPTFAVNALSDSIKVMAHSFYVFLSKNHQQWTENIAQWFSLFAAGWRHILIDQISVQTILTYSIYECVTMSKYQLFINVYHVNV